jgi:3-phenylpropionate/trans-cinnamate dioxygenase ferredoxin subunit
MSEPGFESVTSVDALPENTPIAVQLTNGEEICLVRVNERVYAFEDRCTHAEFPMSDGEMVDDYVIECGLHGAQFDVRSGEVLELPATDELSTYEVKLEDGTVWVKARGTA